MTTVYMLGAGASKAVLKDAPLNNRLLPDALSLSTKNCSDERIEAIKTFITQFYGSSVEPSALPPLEDVLSQIDICIAEKRSLSAEYGVAGLKTLRENLVYAICKLLQDRLWSGSIQMMRDFVSHLQPDDVVISTNYDLIIDNAIPKAAGRPDYGFPIRAFLEKDGDDWMHWVDEEMRRPDRTPIKLLKLHGSLNWLYCRFCQRIDVTPGLKGAIYIFSENRPLVCTHCGTRYDPFIVTPTFINKYENLYLGDVWQQAEDQIARADEIVFIGYSLPDADIILRSMLSRAVYSNRQWRAEHALSPAQPTIKVIERKPDEPVVERPAVQQRYERLFGQIEYLPIGFDGYIYPERTEAKKPRARQRA